ncbi:hypothetical protein [Plantactinospora sp. GCM10030261]|uniref:hypothetical protein n=1 Tax=Plantactinospora sp. GCM10030261 TaxID=3273420 RepID=UPI00361D7227
MDPTDLKTRALALRAAGNTPKQIARALGVPRARATALVRGVPVAKPKRPEPADLPLVGCWITRQWSNGLTIADRPADWLDDAELPPLAMGAGLASVAVARENDTNGITVGGFLVDTYCLGAKNALRENLVDREDLMFYLDEFFGGYDTEPLAAPISLAREVVFGAVDYARGLGFDPHPDFRLAAPYLGSWQPPGRITFGREGKPFFQQGPYDDPDRVMRTLDRTIGPGDYHFSVVATE